MSLVLDQLLQQTPHVWTGRQLAPAPARDTHFRALNAMLPGHGWPLGALIELVPQAEGIGEMQLLLPVLTQLCREARDVVLVQPPHVPYPPALVRAGLPLNRLLWVQAEQDAEARWAAEQTLREGFAGAVLLWSDCSREMALRRLQVAARDSGSLAFLYRSPRYRPQASPAALRLLLSAHPQGLQVEVAKTQGGRTGHIVINPAIQ